MGRKSESGGIRRIAGKIRLDIRYRGQRIKPVLDLNWNERNRRAALRLMEEIRLKIRHGVFDPAAYFPEYGGLARVGATRREAPTFKTLAKSYLHTLSDKAHSTRVSYERALKGYWYPAFGDKPHQRDPRLRCARGACCNWPKNRNNVLIPCRRTFAFAVADQVLDESPIESVKNAKVQKECPIRFSLDDADAIIADLRSKASDIVGDYFEFAFFSGLRASEQIALEWRDFDRKRGLLRVSRARVGARTRIDQNASFTRSRAFERAAAVLQRQRARTELTGGAIFIIRRLANRGQTSRCSDGISKRR